LQTDISYGIPKGDVPSVAIIYDVIPKLFKKHYSHTINFSAESKKEFYDSIGRIILWWLSDQNQKQITKVKKLLSISECTKKDFLRFFNYKKDDIIVTPLAADSEFKTQKKDKQLLKKYAVTKPFLLYSGGCDFRKNILSLISSFEHVRQNHAIQLVLVGKAFTETDDPVSKKIITAIKNSPFASDIITPGYLSTKDLISFYSQAKVYVFPTIYEGFGLPILEAFACGCPVISYNNSSIPEVAGDAAMLLHQDESLDKAIEKVITNDRLRKSMIEKGFKQAKLFSWEITTKKILAVLEEFAN
jgi:glycosyltransferase involved in cell wall biosynthesis